MNLTLNIPDPLLRHLESVCGDVPQAVLEGFAAEAYRNGTLSRLEVGQLLGHASRRQTEAFLSSRDAWPAPSIDEVQHDLETLGSIPLP